MERQIARRKIEYLTQYADALQRGMMDKIDDRPLLYTVKNILISSNPLEECTEYGSLNQYFATQEMKPQEPLGKGLDMVLLNVLSGMVNMMNKGQDNEQVGKIVSYYPIIEQDTVMDMKSAKQYRSAI